MCPNVVYKNDSIFFKYEIFVKKRIFCRGLIILSSSVIALPSPSITNEEHTGIDHDEFEMNYGG